MSRLWNHPDDGLRISAELHQNLLVQESLQDGFFPAGVLPFDAADYDEIKLDWEGLFPLTEIEPGNWLGDGGWGFQMGNESTVDQLDMQGIAPSMGMPNQSELTRRNVEARKSVSFTN